MPEARRKAKKPMPPGFDPRETVAYATSREGMVQFANCPKCRAPVMRGFVDGLLTSLDLIPLDALAEIRCVLLRVNTFKVVKFGQHAMATSRSPRMEMLRLPRPKLVLPEHPCRTQATR